MAGSARSVVFDDARAMVMTGSALVWYVGGQTPHGSLHCVAMKRSVRSLTPYVEILLAVAAPVAARAEDGYDLWLRYHLVADAARLAEYRGALRRLVVEGDSPTLRAARDELVTGLTRLRGRAPVVASALTTAGTLILGTPAGSR